MKLYLLSGAIQIKTNCLKKLMKALKKSCGRILVVRQFLYTVCCAHHHNIIKSPKRTNPPWTFWYAVGPVTQYRKVHRTFLPNFFASLKIWTLVFESLQPEIIKIAKQINIYFAILVRWKGLEPPTYWFVASHSIQLSYQRVYVLHFLCSNNITQIK